MTEARDILRNESGFEVRLNARGAAIEGIRVPLHDGPIEAVLDYSDPDSRASDPYFLGVTCGRFANRIANASFRLGERRFQLDATPGQGGHALHGGALGFSHRVWQRVSDTPDDTVAYLLVSPDGDQGFPGTLLVRVTYRLLDGWVLAMDLVAESDASTVISLANHAYFNLSDSDPNVDEHYVWIDAERFTTVGEDLIPTGMQQRVAGSPFDLRKPVRFGNIRTASHEQLELAGGIDHNFVLRGGSGSLRAVAGLLAPDTGLRLTVLTTQPGLQLYGGQHLEDPFRPGQGLCLEAQQFPDAPNQPGFPSAVLHPGHRWSHQTVYRFDRVT
ncbi:MAG: aldose epimerase family protein [Pseudomonadota bacterium]